MSWPPTLEQSDEWGEIGPELVTDPSQMDDDGTVAHVHAPCCGRKVPADAVVDLRDVPSTTCCPGGRGPETDLDYACDGCRWRIINEAPNGWKASSLQRALGAPAEEVRHTRAKERAREERRKKMAAGETVGPMEDHTRRQLRDMGEGMPDGTGPPTNTPRS